MFGRYQNVFRSRWKALWWAAGVLMTAYCTVPSPDEQAASPTAATVVAKAPAAEPDNSWMLGGAAGAPASPAPSHS
jgi:hypothetical protein